MKPEEVKQISAKLALAIMNDIVRIHNYLMEDNIKSAFFEMGSLIESLAERIRNEDQ